MERRAARGESVSTNPVAAKEHRAYLASGAGELFQAVHNGHVVSSLLVLRSARTAYCQSTGTSPEGMRIGASPFLFHSVCAELNREGVRTINLGGTPEGSSLARFKAGFGATEVRLCACTCNVGPVWLKKASHGSSARLERPGPVLESAFRKFQSNARVRASDECAHAREFPLPPVRVFSPCPRTTL